MTLALIVLSVLFLTLALFRLDWAVLVIIAGLPAYLIRFHILGLPLTFLEAMIMIAFGVWFFKNFIPNFKKHWQERAARHKYPFSVEIILLLMISFIAMGVAGFSDSALGIWKAYFLEPILLFIIVFNVFKSKSDWLKVIDAFTVSAAVVSLFALVQQITGAFIANPFWAAEETRRVVSFFGYPNAVGLYLAPLVLIITGRLIALDQKNIIRKIAYAFTIVISISAIYFAKSEGALIGLAAGFVVLGLFINKKTRIATLALLIIGLIGAYSYAPAKNLLIEKATLSDLSGSIRKQQWKETLKMLNDGRFIAGAGLSNYQAAVKPYHQEGLFYNSDNIADFDALLRASAKMRAKYWQPTEIYLYPHNIFLNFWSELGLAGALLFFWIFIKAIFLALKAGRPARSQAPNRYLALGLAAALIAISVHGLVDVPYFKNDLSAMFWLILALIGAQKYLAKEELKEK